MDGARRISSEKLREHQYREGYVRSLEGKGVEGDEENNVEHMWEQVKRAMVESERELWEERTQRMCIRMMRGKLRLREKGLLGRSCWELKMFGNLQRR